VGATSKIVQRQEGGCRWASAGGGLKAGDSLKTRMGTDAKTHLYFADSTGVTEAMRGWSCSLSSHLRRGRSAGEKLREYLLESSHVSPRLGGKDWKKLAEGKKQVSRLSTLEKPIE